AEHEFTICTCQPRRGGGVAPPGIAFEPAVLGVQGGQFPPRRAPGPAGKLPRLSLRRAPGAGPRSERAGGVQEPGKPQERAESGNGPGEALVRFREPARGQAVAEAEDRRADAALRTSPDARGKKVARPVDRAGRERQLITCTRLHL